MNYFNKIEEDLNLIIFLAKKKYKEEIISIFLEGSYGRKEGAFFYKDNRYYPINDYDIMIITKNGWDNVMYLEFKALLEQMKVPRLDISILAIDKFTKKNHSLARYDLIMNSEIIYGDNNILELLEKFDQNKIPFREKEQLFFSRLISFLLFKYKKTKDKHYNLQQLSKSVISAYESNLLQSNIYSSSYVLNKNKFENLDYITKSDKELLRFSYKIKLEPSLINFEEIDEDVFFEKSCIFVREQFFKLLKGKNVLLKNISIYNIYFWLRPKRIVQILLSLVGNKKYFKDLIIISVQLKLFLNDFSLDNKELRKIKKKLEATTKQKLDNADELIEYVIKTRMGWE